MTTTSPAVAGRDRVAGVGAAVVLLLLGVGIPYVLAAIAPLELPTAPSWDGVAAALAGPDDGTLLRRLLGLAAWIAWACFVTSVVTELVAVARRRPTPRIPMLGVTQRAAAVLVAGVVVGLLPGRPGDAHAAVLELPARPMLAETGAPALALATSRDEVAREPARTGRAGDVTSTKDRAAMPTIVVRPHDTLWGLAERHLGSGLRYREIVSLNKGRTQPDGRCLTDPHWIYPGWVLRLPADATGQGVRHRVTEAREQEPPPPLPRPLPAPHRAVLPSAAVEVDRAPGAGEVTGSQIARDVVRPTVTAAAGLPGSAGDRSRAPLVALGLGALTVAGVLAEISRQRRGQQRSRRAGARLEVPAHVARTERLLRSVGGAPPTQRVHDGLALLVDACHEQGRQPPRIALVRVNAVRLELELEDELGEPPGPFHATGPSTWVWSGDERPRPDPDRIMPCPALVSVGTDGDDLVLVNLEAAGSLRVQADTDRAAPMLTAMTTDLVSRSRAGTVTLAVADDLPGAAALAGAAGVETIPASAVGARVQGHADDVADVLRREAARDVSEARDSEVADEVWAPQVVVSGTSDAQPVPWSGSHVLASGDGGGWSLVPEDGDSWRLEPFALTLRPAELRESDRADIADLLRPAAPPPSPVASADLAAVAADVLLALQQVSVPTFATSANAGPPPGLPYVTVLGHVQVQGTDDALIAGRLRRATELVAYLALHPGVGRHELDEVMWPDQRVARTTRNPFVSRARQWLGRTPDGRLYLPLVADEGEYRLLPEVRCDWHDFVSTATAALSSQPTDVEGLVAALALVRGRPFQGVDPTAYAWADADVQEMVSAVVDVAHVAAELMLAGGDLVGATRAVGDGLRVEPCSELLHRDAIRAAAARGDRAGILRAVSRMKASLEALGLGDDLLPETVALLDRVGVR